MERVLDAVTTLKEAGLRGDISLSVPFELWEKLAGDSSYRSFIVFRIGDTDVTLHQEDPS